MKHLRRALLVAGAVAALAACDAVYADPILVPASFSTPTRDAGSLTTPRPAPFACRSEPRENSPCGVVGAECEIGPNSDPLCNTTFECRRDVTYGPYWTEKRASSCTAECPRDGIVDGAPCTIPAADGGATPDEAELQCVSGDALCGCTTGRDGAHAHERRWVCTRAGDGCPVARPNIGATCLGDRACDYGGCTLKRGSGMICDQGVWQVEGAQCPP